MSFCIHGSDWDFGDWWGSSTATDLPTYGNGATIKFKCACGKPDCPDQRDKKGKAE